MARTLAIAKSSGQSDVDMYFTPLTQRTSGEISALQKTLLGLVKSPDGMALMARAGERRAAYLACATRFSILSAKPTSRPPRL